MALQQDLLAQANVLRVLLIMHVQRLELQFPLQAVTLVSYVQVEQLLQSLGALPKEEKCAFQDLIAPAARLFQLLVRRVNIARVLQLMSLLVTARLDTIAHRILLQRTHSLTCVLPEATVLLVHQLSQNAPLAHTHQARVLLLCLIVRLAQPVTCVMQLAFKLLTTVQRGTIALVVRA